MKFKVGDRVRRYNPQNSNGGHCDLIVGIIYEIKNEEIFLMQKDGYKHLCCPCKAEDLELLSEAKMSKYEELKAKIKGLENGWDKEADDILQEITKTSSTSYDIIFRNYSYNHLEDNAGRIWIVNRAENLDRRFDMEYHFQCEKMTAFKQALLWLLNHSDIKKDEKAEEIKKLEEELGKLKERIEELKR